MSNACTCYITIKGKESDRKNFKLALEQKHPVFIGRGMVIESEEDSFKDKEFLYGWCKNSVKDSLIRCADSMKRDPEQWRFEENTPVEIMNLYEACDYFKIEIEVFSEEPECQFSEHILISGEDRINETRHFEEIFFDDYDSKEEAEEETGYEFTDEEYKKGYAERGGFRDRDSDTYKFIL